MSSTLGQLVPKVGTFGLDKVGQFGHVKYAMRHTDWMCSKRICVLLCPDMSEFCGTWAHYVSQNENDAIGSSSLKMKLNLLKYENDLGI